MRTFINYAALTIGVACLVGIAAVREARSDQYLVFKLERARAACAAGNVPSCAEAMNVVSELSSKGWCYGRPSDTLPWQREKTGWVRCVR